MTELFRFVLARPAKKASDPIVVGPRFKDMTFDEIKIAFPRSIGAFHPLQLSYGAEIQKLNESLPEELSDHKNIQAVVDHAFGKKDVAHLVTLDEWRRDEDLLDLELVRIYVTGRDVESMGPVYSRMRQLYDLVRAHINAKPDVKIELRPLMLPMTAISPETITTIPKRENEAVQSLGFNEDDGARAARIANLATVLRVLNMTDTQAKLDMLGGVAEQFNLLRSWEILLPQGAQEIVRAAFPGTESVNMKTINDWAVQTLRSERITPPATFESGIFSMGTLNVRVSRPWILPGLGPIQQPGDEWTPKRVGPSLIQPTGIADLIVVREHIYRYDGGEIGSIQNVLESEKMLRETKRLDRAEVVDVSSQEQKSEEERDASSTERFSLARESSNIVKSDNSSKSGASLNAKYGPFVEVKTDISVASNQSSEAAEKVASQFSKDVTSRAASKVIQKTFKSTSISTIAQFEENFRHEFDNATDGGSGHNISGVYQWVNKVSQARRYNYGKRLLMDIIVPEPAAFLMDSITHSGPELQEPVKLTEVATDIDESNYAQIGARYQVVGIKPPPELFRSFSVAFKDPTPAGTPETEVYAIHNTSFSVDLKIPEGYLAYSATLTVNIVEGRRRPEHFLPGHVFNPRVAIGGLDIPVTLTGSPPATPPVWSFFPPPYIAGTVGFSMALDEFASLAGSVRVNCIRSPEMYKTWQLTTYDTIAQTYIRAKQEYDRATAEAEMGALGILSGQNPDDNATIIRNELKKACISMITSQNFNISNAINVDSNGIPEINNFAKAQVQGRYIQFVEQAFEWENLQFVLYPYYWARKETWRDRVAFSSADPDFSSFARAGAAKVTLPARIGFSTEVLYFLETGDTWMGGPVSALRTSPYYSLAEEIDAAEKQTGKEVAVGEPWFTVVPTSLVKLREDSVLPVWKPDKATGLWIERKPDDTTPDDVF
ncbi:hypothetical protein FBEOM_12864 [Fusarium beomiforme]|uniref:Uncharacterized protein n=1 Tax=Fusarium beomiforme TaxID=44412 RepID=A0A9P5DS38_9HYPO|nr:hypothetical protein FBEOM_12864 [Fusarium beomiforme]